MRIILGPNRIRCGQHRRTSIEGGDDAGLGHRHCLLLHDLMQNAAGCIRHLVEFVDTTHTTI